MVLLLELHHSTQQDGGTKAGSGDPSPGLSATLSHKGRGTLPTGTFQNDKITRSPTYAAAQKKRPDMPGVF